MFTMADGMTALRESIRDRSIFLQQQLVWQSHNRELRSTWRVSVLPGWDGTDYEAWENKTLLLVVLDCLAAQRRHDDAALAADPARPPI